MVNRNEPRQHGQFDELTVAAQLICEALDLHRRDAQKTVQENDEKHQ